MAHFFLFFIVLLMVIGISSKWDADSKALNTNKTAFTICMLFLCFLASFRSSIVGNDTHSYIYIFGQAEEYMKYGSRFEIGYVYLNYLLSKVTNNPQYIFIICSVFIYYSYGHFIWKYSKMPWLSLLLFFLLTFGSTVNIMRQMIAISILLWSVDFLIQKKPLLFAATIVFATLFHNTAFLFAPIWFLPRLQLNRRIVLLMSSIAIIMYIGFSGLLNYAFSYFSMYEYYSEGMYFEGEVRLASIIQLVISLGVSMFGYLAYQQYKDDQWKGSEEGQSYKLLLLMQFVATVIYFLCLKVNLLDRIALYYSAFSIINIANAIALYPNYRRKSLAYIVLLFLLIYNSTIMTLRPEWNRVYPYEFCWQDNHHI